MADRDIEQAADAAMDCDYCGQCATCKALDAPFLLDPETDGLTWAD